MDRAVDAAALAGNAPVVELTLWALFAHADLLGKAVILVLVSASFWSWAIIIDKLIRLRKVQSQAEAFEDMFWSGGSLDDLYDRIGSQPPDPMSAMFGAAMRVWRRSAARGMSTIAIRERFAGGRELVRSAATAFALSLLEKTAAEFPALQGGA